MEGFIPCETAMNITLIHATQAMTTELIGEIAVEGTMPLFSATSGSAMALDGDGFVPELLLGRPDVELKQLRNEKLKSELN